MTTRVSIWLSCLIFAMAIQAMLPASDAALKVGYYKHTNLCPNAETIVKGVVHNAVLNKTDPEGRGNGAGLIRMFFHDCFVMGCDGSVLLDNSSSNPFAEKFAIPNNPSLRGFEIIDDAKAALEKECPGKVSCADIVAFAARDATYILGNISYKIPSGRYDGKVSNGNTALASLPAPFFNLAQLNASFSAVGLSEVDMVTLSGAHSIGRSHCSSFTSRLYPTIDTTLNKTFAEQTLEPKCPLNAAIDGVVPQDFVTPNVLDKQYYENVKSRTALFFSDWSLLTSPDTLKLVEDYRTKPGLFELNFAISMVNMGNIGILDATKGEIRKSCRATL